MPAMCGAAIKVPLNTLHSMLMLSKMVRFAPCWNDMGAEEFAQFFKFVQEVFRLPRVSSSWCLTGI